MRRFRGLGPATALIAGLVMVPAEATILRLDATEFRTAAGMIGWDEVAPGTLDPVLHPVDYGGGATAPVVRTGGRFLGQQRSIGAVDGCAGAAGETCIGAAPTAPLALDPDAPAVVTAIDGALASSPTLSGTPRFHGAIALLFDRDQTGVAIEAGYFNAIASTRLTAFGRDGRVLASTVNRGLGVEFFGLASDAGVPVIAGLLVDLVAPEPFGFNIDNLRFAAIASDTSGETAPVPLPAGATLLLAGLGTLFVLARHDARRGRPPPPSLA